MNGRHRKQEKNEIIKKLFVFLFFLISLFAMGFSGMKIFNWLIENKNSDDIAKDARNDVFSDEKNKYSVDFKSLQEKNSETIAWLKVSSTNIEYPIVKTSDNEFYMNHNFDRSQNSAGWIFMDYRNKLDSINENMVIYGHNRRDGSMFGTLKKVLTKEWLNNPDNFIIPFITEREEVQYQVFSVYKTEKESYYITTNFETNEKFVEFVNKIKSRSIKDFGITPQVGDNILTLSTCADNDKYRVVLHAKKIT